MNKTSQQTYYRRSMQITKHAAFSFLELAKEEIFRDILNLDISKTSNNRYSFQNH